MSVSGEHNVRPSTGASQPAISGMLPPIFGGAAAGDYGRHFCSAYLAIVKFRSRRFATPASGGSVHPGRAQIEESGASSLRGQDVAPVRDNPRDGQTPAAGVHETCSAFLEWDCRPEHRLGRRSDVWDLVVDPGSAKRMDRPR